MFALAWYNSSEKEPLIAENPSFRMLRSDELFFRNLRIAEYYSYPTINSGGMEILCHKNLDSSKTLLPCIFINASVNEAFLRFSSSVVRAVSRADTVLLDADGDVTETFHSGAKLLDLVERGGDIQISSKEGFTTTIVAGSSEMQAIRESLKDYFRLVRYGNNH
jgi:hypothetical protein